jgi:HEAT repeat protein
MKNNIQISQKARSIPLKVRKDVIRSLKETDMHRNLKKLFEKMETDYHVEITHGPNELGKDLVIVKKDSITTDVIGIIVKRET